MTQSGGGDSINYEGIVPHRGVEIYELEAGWESVVNNFGQLPELVNQLTQLNLAINSLLPELSQLGSVFIDWQQLEVIIARAINQDWTPIVSEAFETIGAGAVLPGNCSVRFFNNGPNPCRVLGVPLLPQQERNCGGCSRTLISNPLYFDAQGSHLIIMVNYPSTPTTSSTQVKDVLLQLLSSDSTTQDKILNIVNNALQAYLDSRNC